MKILSNIWNWEPLQGYKTYLSAFLMVVLAGFRALHYIDDAQYQTILAVLVGAGMAAIRDGSKKVAMRHFELSFKSIVPSIKKEDVESVQRFKTASVTMYR